MAKMAKTRQVMKLNDGTMNYVCVWNEQAPHYRLYWVHNSYPHTHKTCILKANTMRQIVEYIADDYALLERKFG